MESFVAGIISAAISAVVSGVILLYLTNSIKKSSDDATRATEAEKKLIQKDLSDMTTKFASMERRFAMMEQKQDNMVEGFHEVKERLSLLAQRQEDFKTRLFEVIQMIEKMSLSGNFGKVIKK